MNRLALFAATRRTSTPGQIARKLGVRPADHAALCAELDTAAREGVLIAGVIRDRGVQVPTFAWGIKAP